LVIASWRRAAAAAAEWLSVSEPDVIWFIHIISSTHLVGPSKQRMRAGKGLITDTVRNKSATEFHLHFKQASA